MPKKAKLRIGETSAMIADELRREMKKREDNESKEIDKKRVEGFRIEFESRLPGIKENYPHTKKMCWLPVQRIA